MKINVVQNDTSNSYYKPIPLKNSSINSAYVKKTDFSSQKTFGEAILPPTKMNLAPLLNLKSNVQATITKAELPNGLMEMVNTITKSFAIKN